MCATSKRSKRFWPSGMQKATRFECLWLHSCLCLMQLTTSDQCSLSRCLSIYYSTLLNSQDTTHYLHNKQHQHMYLESSRNNIRELVVRCKQRLGHMFRRDVVVVVVLPSPSPSPSPSSSSAPTSTSTSSLS